jgi:hypothetical protein
MAGRDSEGGTFEQRLRMVEDRLEIYNLVATHPPSALGHLEAHGFDLSPIFANPSAS